MRTAAAADLGIPAALGVYLRWIRPRVFSWGATRDEASRPMAGDELCPHPQLNATRAVTIAARPEAIVTELILMEIGDPFMMRKCLLGIKRRAEQLADGRRLQR
jgi:hypothetical protein